MSFLIESDVQDFEIQLQQTHGSIHTSFLFNALLAYPQHFQQEFFNTLLKRRMAQAYLQSKLSNSKAGQLSTQEIRASSRKFIQFIEALQNHQQSIQPNNAELPTYNFYMNEYMLRQIANSLSQVQEKQPTVVPSKRQGRKRRKRKNKKQAQQVQESEEYVPNFPHCWIEELKTNLKSLRILIL